MPKMAFLTRVRQKFVNEATIEACEDLAVLSSEQRQIGKVSQDDQEQASAQCYWVYYAKR
jgi:hypothetical protein